MESPAINNTRFDRPQHMFLVLLVTGSIMLFFKADELMGAVGLRDYYMFLGTAFFALLLAFAALLFGLWGNISIPIALFASSAIIITVAAMNRGMVIVGWFTSILPSCIPPIALVIIFAIFVLAQLLGQVKKDRLLVSTSSKLAMLILLIYTANFVLGIGTTYEPATYGFRGDLEFGNHHFYLVLHHGWLGDPDSLALYECNQYALYCNAVYYSPDEYYWDKQVTLVPDAESNSLRILVDGEVLHTHTLPADN